MPVRDNAQDPIRTVLDDLRQIIRALRITSRASEKACGLGAAQLFVLRQLESERAISINELADRTLTHQSSVSVVVRKLLDQKLIVRRASGADSRRVEVSLTELGKRKLRKAPRSVQEDLVEALRRMPQKDCVELALLLSKLVRESGYAVDQPPLMFEDDLHLKINAQS